MKSLPVYPQPQRPRFWRSLEELEGIERREETSQEALAWAKGMDRRELFKFGGVSLALAGLTACTRQPTEKIIPYVRQPEEIKPGTPLFFATAMPLSGYATGLLVESHMGRPTKVEGNPLHPASLGATDLFSQASIYGLYDPDRSQSLTYLGEIRAWPAFLSAMRLAVEKAREKKGAGLRILTETVGSPTLGAQLRALLMELPEAKWHQWEPANRDNAWAGAAMAFGQPLDPVLDVSKADVILSLDADFFSCGPGHLKSVADFAARRRTRNRTAMNRLYCVEAAPGVTGASADHRLPMRASQVEAFARTVAALVGGGGGGASSASPFAQAVAEDLKAHRGKSLVVAGDYQPPAVHAIAHALNDALGNTGQTVSWIEPIPVKPESHADSFRRLVADMESGAVETLVIVGGNPAFTAPGDLGFAKALDKVKVSAHLSLHQDETSTLCRWHVPEAHYLESWSDARAFDGTASILQPLIAPLYGGKTAHEVIAALTSQPERTSYEIVRDYWKDRMGGDFEGAWRRALHDGVIEGSASARKTVRAGSTTGREGQAPPLRHEAGGRTDLEIQFRADPTVYDGRFANNGWLQELPKAVTKLTWDNAVLLAPATAKKLNVASEDVLRLTWDGRSVEAPAWIVPGHAEDSATLHFGYGRTHAGTLGSKTGFSASALQSSKALAGGSGLEIAKAGRTYALVTTQHHQNMEGRAIVRAATLEEFEKTPEFAHEMEEAPGPEESMYAHYPPHEYAWAMAIDLNACTGCGACTLACQAENNIPTVGKKEVSRGHAMHWIRVDRYFEGSEANPATYHQPVPCMHCENAPCELVCPVGATVHSAEGLNDMVYNRCVGTRYCANNCPYKVRHFNYFHYGTQFRPPSMRMLANPEVTVRWRGVMEKCTYCVQRITVAKIGAEKENRRVRDGEIVTACQQACPAKAIVFGDLADASSEVSNARKSPANYGLLEDLGTRPRTTYLAAVRNPNPSLEKTGVWDVERKTS
ncbi:MAG TPA: 4Fe-4S dicluster domain-containing protein [Thermoanaerobaculia bacterium]|nr:4Fe-4S dicluster domain-containing protein [Thermoanaerobaculia bacterium]